MPNQTTGHEIQRPDLAALLMEHADPISNVDRILFPTFKTRLQASGYPIIPAESTLKLPADSEIRRAARAAYARGDWKFERGTFACQERGFEEPVDDSEAELYADYFDAESISAMLAYTTIRRSQAKRIFDMCLDTDTVSSADVTHEWDDADNATPIDDVNDKIETVRLATGVTPNTLVIAESTFKDLGLCSQIVDRIKYTNAAVQRGAIPANLLALALNVEQVLVVGDVYDAAKEGQAKDITELWDPEYAFLCKVAKTPQNLKEPCIGRTFLWTQDSPDNVVVETYRENATRGDVVRARQYTDECYVMTECGYILSNIYTTS